MQLITARRPEIRSADLLPAFGTHRTIFGTLSKVCYETKIEFCIKECHPAYEEDSDMPNNSELDSLSGLRTTATGYPLSEERGHSSREIA